jgi:hypothetical protein
MARQSLLQKFDATIGEEIRGVCVNRVDAKDLEEKIGKDWDY